MIWPVGNIIFFIVIYKDYLTKITYLFKVKYCTLKTWQIWTWEQCLMNPTVMIQKYVQSQKTILPSFAQSKLKKNSIGGSAILISEQS